MIYAIVAISLIGIIGMLICLLFFPTIKIKGKSFQTFWIPPFISACILLVSYLVPFDYFSSFLVSSKSINPLEILGLFLSMSFISLVLDEAGFFSYLASKVIKKAGKSQIKVFIFIYLLTSLLTVFTSNDIIILTFTPFLIFFCKQAKVNPLPFLVEEFVAANTWSMILLIGNPTNIYLGQSFNISFLSYFLKMWPSAFCSGVISFLIMFLLFYKKLKISFSDDICVEEVRIKDLPLMIASLACLLICILLMALANLFSWPLWLICVCSASSLLVFSFIYLLFNKNKFKLLVYSIKRIPYVVVPFVLSMFVIVLGFKSSGITSAVATFLGTIDPIWSYGISSFFISNLANNIPTSVLYVEIINESSLSLNAIYASIISSNVGAILTPIGALAGIMWMGLLKDHDIKYNFLDFVKYGVVIALPTLAVALVCLYLPI